MDELQIPTRPVAVDIVTDGGQTLAGTLFMTETRYTTGCPEEVVEVLNDERGFIPFRLRGGRHDGRDVVLNKDHILRVRLRGADPVPKGRRAKLPARAARRRSAVAEPAGAPPASSNSEPTVLHLSDGTRLEGRIAVETPWASSRLLDKLNQEFRFIPLIRDDGGYEFVHRAHVVRLD